MTNLDQIGAEAIRLMTGADRDVKKAQAHIKQVWDAYTAAEEAVTPIVVNGAKSKTEWAKLINRSTRYCQMIAKDGDRKNQKKKDDPNSVRPTFLSRCADAKKKLADIQRELDAPFQEGETRDTKAIFDRIDPAINEVYREFLALISPDGYEVSRTDRGWDVQEKDEQPTEPQATKRESATKKEEKKPIKHAKNPKTFGTWCHMSLRAKTAHQTRYATCPFCIAAMAAGLTVANPEMQRRDKEKELKDARGYLAEHERTVERCLPKNQKDRSYQHAVKVIPEYREEIAKLEQELAAIKRIKTPEQAVEAAKTAARKAAAEREAQRLAHSAEKQIVAVIVNECQTTEEAL